MYKLYMLDKISENFMHWQLEIERESLHHHSYPQTIELIAVFLILLFKNIWYVLQMKTHMSKYYPFLCALQVWKDIATVLFP